MIRKPASMLIATALSEFARSLKYEAVPSAVARRAKLLLLDAIGVAFAATRYEFAKKGLAGIRRFGGGDAIVIGSECTLNLRGKMGQARFFVIRAPFAFAYLLLLVQEVNNGACLRY